MAGGTSNFNKGLYSFIPFRCRSTRRVAQKSGEMHRMTPRFLKREVVKFAAAF